MAGSAVTCVDDSKTVALGVGENHEIGVLGIEVPIDPLGAKRKEPRHLGGLIGGIAGIQVQVDPRMLLQGGLAAIERNLDAGCPVWRDKHDPVVFLLGIPGLETQGLAPEIRRPPGFCRTQDDASNAQHVLILAW